MRVFFRKNLLYSGFSLIFDFLFLQLKNKAFPYQTSHLANIIFGGKLLMRQGKMSTGWGRKISIFPSFTERHSNTA